MESRRSIQTIEPGDIEWRRETRRPSPAGFEESWFVDRFRWVLRSRDKGSPSPKSPEKVSLKRAIIRKLDTPLGRPLLAAMATSQARRALQDNNVKVTYRDGMWLHRVGGHVVPDGIRFDYYGNSFAVWKNQIPAYLADARDYWFGHYQPEAGDVIVDVGAGRGEDVLAYSQAVGDSGIVLAIEAHPVSWRIMERFCALNGLVNTRLVQAAAMDKPGTVMIEDDGQWEANTVSESGLGTPVRAVTLDGLLKDEGITRIDFLKMNIEGAEVNALTGMSESISMVNSISVCCHDFRADRGDGESFRTRDFVRNFLTAKGFDISRCEDDPRPFVRDHLHGTRRS